MLAHTLAKYLLECPNEDVKINGWGSDEGGERSIDLIGIEENERSDGKIDKILYLGYFRDNEYYSCFSDNINTIETTIYKKIVKNKKDDEINIIKARLSKLSEI